MIESIKTPGMGVNCYLLACERTKKAILIDPGAGSKMIESWVKDKDFEIVNILLTHGHYDHIGSVEYLRKEFNTQVAIHKDDAEMLTDPTKNLSSFLGMGVTLSPAEILLEDNQEIEVGEMSLKVIHTPGHTPGGICILTDDGLISGDTLFDGSVGRADFPGGNMQVLISSIQNRLMDLPDETVVYPGHESRTTIGREKSSNPFINGNI